MRAKKKLKPGQDGTKALLDEYGDRLVCVRYRYDEELRVRYKTVELIVETVPWVVRRREAFSADTIVALAIDLTEVALQTQVRRQGGIWNPARGLLEVRYDQVVAMGLEDRIFLPNSGKSRTSNSRKAPMDNNRKPE